MPLATPHALAGGRLTRTRRIIARAFLLLCCTSLPGLASTHSSRRIPALSSLSTDYDQALRMREALEGRPQQQRTRREYDRVLDAFRAVYRGNPHGAHSDASVIAVAELLSAEGRLFQDRRLSLEAIGQYEQLRRQYPASSYRYSALLTEGEIYDHDLGDRTAARSIFTQFLKQYPQNALADEAKQALQRSRAGPAPAGTAHGAGGARMQAAIASPQHSASHGSHTAVLDAARALQPPPRSASAASRPAANAQPMTVQAPSAGSSPPGPRRPSSTLVERDLPSGSVAQAPASGAGGQASRVGDTSRSLATDEAQVQEAALNATPPPRGGGLPLVTGVRHWSTSVYTRVAIDLDAPSEVKYEASRAPNPDRIFFDLHGVKLSPELIGKAVTVTDGGYLKRVRAAQFSGDVVRVVLDVSDVSEYSAFFLPNPSRLIIDIHGKAPALVANAASDGAASRAAAPPAVPVRRIPASPNVPSAAPPGPPAGENRSAPQSASTSLPSSAATANRTAASTRNATGSHGSVDPLGDIATLDRQPDTVKATRSPTTAPVAAAVANTTPAPQTATVLAPAPETGRRSRPSRSETKSSRAAGITPADPSAPAIHAEDAPSLRSSAAPARAAVPTLSGERSMVRALGLKIGRIVVDAGHGGHDSGTLGPGGIEEKDVVLDVALRLGRVLKQRLGADVIFTRDDDTFIPLETRTAIANKAQADLFISVHANSSQDATARGVETYYLNFTSSADALEVAARENAVSDQSIHQLSDLVKKITLQDKISESREFAGDVEQSLYSGLEPGNPGMKDRGVKKAPFVVLIGANMPSILAEISFLTNPDDAHQLRDGEYRQRIAESLYRGVAKYIGSLSGVRLAEGAARPVGE